MNISVRREREQQRKIHRVNTRNISRQVALRRGDAVYGELLFHPMCTVKTQSAFKMSDIRGRPCNMLHG